MERQWVSTHSDNWYLRTRNWYCHYGHSMPTVSQWRPYICSICGKVVVILIYWGWLLKCNSIKSICIFKVSIVGVSLYGRILCFTHIFIALWNIKIKAYMHLLFWKFEGFFLSAKQTVVKTILNKSISSHNKILRLTVILLTFPCKLHACFFSILTVNSFDSE